MRETEAVDLWAYEHAAFSDGYRLVCGIDEAGRGPLAGPVVMRTSGVSVTSAAFQPVVCTHQTRQTSKNASAAARQKHTSITFNIFRASPKASMGIADAAAETASPSPR